jgi:hypothetical protein
MAQPTGQPLLPLAQALHRLPKRADMLRQRLHRAGGAVRGAQGEIDRITRISSTKAAPASDDQRVGEVEVMSPIWIMCVRTAFRYR